MHECSNGNLASRTECILTYGGSTRDIIINYVVFGIDLIMSYVVFLAWRDQRSKRLPAVLSLVFVFFFQLSLCWIVACTGISVVWCAICGWMLHEQRQLSQQQQQPQPEGFRKCAMSTLSVLIIPLNMGIIFYYALVSPFLTTVAHFCAMVLGVLLSKMALKQQQQNPVTETTNNDTPLVEGNSSRTAGCVE